MAVKSAYHPLRPLNGPFLEGPFSAMARVPLLEMFRRVRSLCCRNMCCVSRFCTGGRGAAGSRSRQMSKAP